MKLPDKVHIILKGSGEYEDFSEGPVRAYTNAEDAENELTKLKRIAGFTAVDSSKQSREAVKAAYKKLGYDADEYTSWRVAACPLKLVLPLAAMAKLKIKKQED